MSLRVLLQLLFLRRNTQTNTHAYRKRERHTHASTFSMQISAPDYMIELVDRDIRQRLPLWETAVEWADAERQSGFIVSQCTYTDPPSTKCFLPLVSSSAAMMDDTALLCVEAWMDSMASRFFSEVSCFLVFADTGGTISYYRCEGARPSDR